ncbi:Rha family transcriptional regulator [Neisseria elongata]|uniref:Rha family transcriptional regulator n=1 Tax=Neisseria elongata TaxID=495 RepID=UPI000E0D8A32|nr:Rha family transcriptional regulator [Neisseria elongata]
MNTNNTQLVQISGDRLVTTSLAVSNHFAKKHKNVLQAIENLECSDEFAKLNFQLCYKNNELQNGKPQPFYEITRDGFVFLCMGFTGSAAAQWKEKYIAAFNTLEAEIRRRLPDMLEVDREQLQWMHDRAELLQEAYLKAHPDMVRLMRYQQMDLDLEEKARLMGISKEAVRHRLKELDRLGIIDYRPDPRFSRAGKLGCQARIQKRALLEAQQSLGLED